MTQVDPPGTTPDPATSDPLEPFRGRRTYLSLTSFRRDGSGVTTPVWCVVDGDRVLMRTDSESHKVKRLRRNPSVIIASCDFRGERRGPEAAGVAEELPATERKRIERLLLRKYPVGLAVEVTFLRPVHAVSAALGRGKKRGTPCFFAIVPKSKLEAIRVRAHTTLALVGGFVADVPESILLVV